MPIRPSLWRQPPTWPILQYEDLRIVPGDFQLAGAADPALDDWQPGGAGIVFQVFCFVPNDEVFFTCQLPHSWRHGTDLLAHVHWTPRARGVLEAGKTVAWHLDYAVSNVDGFFPPSTTLDLTDTVHQALNHVHYMSPMLVIPGAALRVSAMLACRLYRAAGDTWAGVGAVNAPAILEFDVHYVPDSLGSDVVDAKTY